jgi:isoleucyl-tRNA synthetase
MALVMRLVSLGHSARNQSGLKLRQPLSEAAFAVATSEERRTVERHASLIAEELNVKRVRLLDALTEAASYQLKPLPKQLGQRFGARFPAIRQAVLALEADRAPPAAAGESIQIELDGEPVTLTSEEVEVRLEAHPGFAAASEGGYVAALDTRLTPELQLEGLSREFIRRLQELRKQQGLAVDDQIRVQFAASPRLAEAVQKHQGHIVAETLAVELTSVAPPEAQAFEQHSFDGETLALGLRPA